MLRPLITATAAVVLLAGCSGGDDKASDSTADDGGQSASSPATPEVPSFDPPKAFSPVAGLAEPQVPGDNDYTVQAGIVGQTSLYAGANGITGVNVTGAHSWQVLSKEDTTTTTSDSSSPMALQLDGKEVIGVVYVQRVQGSGTQKAHGQVLFQWIDPTEGKVITSIPVDLTPLLGPDNGGKDIVSQTYDAATGQIAVAVSAGSAENAKKAGTFTVFADPKAKKSTVTPFFAVAGLLDGKMAGAVGDGQEGATDLTIATADATTGKVTKKTPVKANYLRPAGFGAKRAYLSGSVYVPAPPGKLDGYYASSVYSVDIAGGTFTTLTSTLKDDMSSVSYECRGDQKNSVVCSGSRQLESVEIIGFDDSTGKKVWGYTNESASRVVPSVTTVFHGVVYAQAEKDAVLMDAATGQDIASPTPTPGDGGTPSDGATPSANGTPSESTPTESSSSSDNIGGFGDTTLLYGEPKSPSMVSTYGSVYLLEPGDKAPMSTETVLVVQKAIG
ncbi:hypothetical protein ACIBG5_20160 [Kribbella sp. NPDC050241]|uniref:hypothetical protein n=1 Tax=Kribbella sp. NPDC050241 TaxID=3364115 RepID=UPI003790EC08